MLTANNVSCVTCHMSNVMCHMSCVIGEAYQWRVCYQRGFTPSSLNINTSKWSPNVFPSCIPPWMLHMCFTKAELSLVVLTLELCLDLWLFNRVYMFSPVSPKYAALQCLHEILYPTLFFPQLIVFLWFCEERFLVKAFVSPEWITFNKSPLSCLSSHSFYTPP